MATVWHGVVNPPRGGSVREWHYDDQEIVLKKGEEMGRFLLGSTVARRRRAGRRNQPRVGSGVGAPMGRWGANLCSEPLR